MTVQEALDIIDREAQLMRTHDTVFGSQIIAEAVAFIRRHLRGLGYALAGLLSVLLLASCAKKAAPPSTLTAAPGVSDAVIQRYAAVAVLPTPTIAPGEFDCIAYAKAQIPWKHDFPSPIHQAAHEATMPPDDHQFDRMRQHGCSVLQQAWTREQKLARPTPAPGTLPPGAKP
jgi:hypothetical protein